MKRTTCLVIAALIPVVASAQLMNTVDRAREASRKSDDFAFPLDRRSIRPPPAKAQDMTVTMKR